MEIFIVSWILFTFTIISVGVFLNILDGNWRMIVKICCFVEFVISGMIAILCIAYSMGVIGNV